MQSLLRQSQTAHALATANKGSFKDSALNSLTSRIQDDQKVIQETVWDIARQKEINLSRKTVSIVSDVLNKEEYLKRQITLLEEIHSIAVSSASPVLKNMKGRIETTLETARNLQRELIQAEEERPNNIPME